MPRNVQITVQLHSFHMLVRLCSKSFKLGCNSIWTENFPMYRLNLERAEEEEINCQLSLDHRENKGIPKRRKSTSASLTMLKPLTVWIRTNCRKYLKRQEYQTILLDSWEICMQVKNQQLELDMEKLTGSKLGEEYVKAVYCHPAYLTYMQRT